MDYRFGVEILASTQPDWFKFTSIIKTLTGQSPTRDLDKKNIAVGNAGSFAMAIEAVDGNSQAVGDLSKAKRSLDFIHFTFIISIDDCDALDKFCNLLDGCRLQYRCKSLGYVIFESSVKNLRYLIQGGCELEEFRPIYNSMYMKLCNHGLSTAFGMKKGLPDGTFLLNQ